MNLNILGDSAASIAKPGRECICRANHLLVEEAGTPHLARNKTCTKDTDKKPDGKQLAFGISGSGEEGGNSTNDQATGKGPARSKAIAAGPSNQSDKQCCTQRDNVGVGNIDLGQFQVFLNGIVQLPPVRPRYGGLGFKTQEYYLPGEERHTMTRRPQKIQTRKRKKLCRTY